MVVKFVCMVANIIIDMRPEPIYHIPNQGWCKLGIKGAKKKKFMHW